MECGYSIMLQNETHNRLSLELFFHSFALARFMNECIHLMKAWSVLITWLGVF